MRQNDPVTADVVLPSGSWQIAAIPKGGWDVTPPNTWMLRLLILVAGGLILVPTVMTGRLIDERLKNIKELKRREVQLARLSRRLKLALDSSKIGVWELNTETNDLFWDDRVNELYGYPADGGHRDYTHWERSIHPDDLARVLAETERVNATGDAFQTRVPSAASQRRDQARPREREGLPEPGRAKAHRRRQLGRDRRRCCSTKT